MLCFLSFLFLFSLSLSGALRAQALGRGRAAGTTAYAADYRLAPPPPVPGAYTAIYPEAYFPDRYQVGTTLVPIKGALHTFLLH